MTTIIQLKCQYCGKALTSEEYDHAISEFKMKAAQEYKEKYENERVEFERREKKLRSDNEELKKIHNKDITYIRQNERASYKQKYEDAKKGI